jgi:hypothetical protein
VNSALKNVDIQFCSSFISVFKKSIEMYFITLLIVIAKFDKESDKMIMAFWL